MTEMNEIEAAARDAKRVRDAAEREVRNKSGDRGEHWPIVPIAIGVGSAALAAALLYANRSWKK